MSILRVTGVVLCSIGLITACQTPFVDQAEPEQYVPFVSEQEGRIMKEASMTEESKRRHGERTFDIQNATPYLALSDFTERWNAISTEQGSDLIIQSFDGGSTHEERYNRALLSDFLELQVYSQGGLVNRIEVAGSGMDKDSIYSMLTAWSQVILILGEDHTLADVNWIFHDLGVGPNGDIDVRNSQSILSDGIEYTISLDEDRYTFEAGYES